MSDDLVEAGKATRFKPGQVTNPGGRPKKKPLTDELRRLLRESSDGSQYTNAHMVAWEMIQRAKAGDVPAARLIWEYIEGKPVQPIDLRRSLTDEAERMAQELGMSVADAMREVEAVLAEARRG